MMYLPFIGKVEQLLAKSDQQNLGNDDSCKKMQSKRAIQQLAIQKIISGLYKDDKFRIHLHGGSQQVRDFHHKALELRPTR